MDKITIEPIAYVKSPFKEKFGIPRQSGRVNSITAQIVFNKPYNNPDALRGLDGFSHVWVIFGFSEVKNYEWTPTVRPPRLGGNVKTGVFASRSPFRPNRLGLSSAKIDKIEYTNDGVIISVLGLDLLDGTPVYDIKPYLPFTDCHTDAVGGYADKVKDYRIKVVFPENLIKYIPDNLQTALIECLQEDPRPSYQDDNREYGMKFSEFNVKFVVLDGVLTVTSVEKI
jgi:tRNA-Thr(GGU) m(6)t(6)A37 methyltransferase TsaA